MPNRGRMGWKMGDTSGVDALSRVRNRKPATSVFDKVETRLQALTHGHGLLWAYHPASGHFEFRGEARLFGLPEEDFASLGELAGCFDTGEIERFEAALRAQDVHSARDLSDVWCVLRLKDLRALIFRGRKGDKGIVTGIVTEAGRAVAEKADPGRIDALTGLSNRPGFLSEAARMLIREGEYDLVVADLARFRRLNEALGHDRADQVLALLAQRLRDVFGADTVIGRLGEDEFGVLTPRGFPRVSDRMRGALERAITIAGFELHPTFAMGAVAVAGGEAALQSAELIRRAEMALEAARAKGAGGVAAYKRDLESDGLSRLALEADLRRSFISGEIQPWFQPIVHLDGHGIAGFEALARWVHPKRGVVPPDHFLGAARDLGLMGDLGLIILKATVALLTRWHKTYTLPEGFFISVNLSAPEIERPLLVEDVSRLIREAGLPRGALKLEVTESDVMRDPETCAQVLEALRQAGAGLALDDFGTGFSSLSYLARLPFDSLKIDRSFVSTLDRETASEKIVRAVLTLGRDLGLDVVAEGVEDTALADRLHGLGCDLGQGYGFARPLKLADAEGFLAKALGYDIPA